jgi:hypothetical protein
LHAPTPTIDSILIKDRYAPKEEDQGAEAGEGGTEEE